MLARAASKSKRTPSCQKTLRWARVPENSSHRPWFPLPKAESLRKLVDPPWFPLPKKFPVSAESLRKAVGWASAPATGPSGGPRAVAPGARWPRSPPGCAAIARWRSPSQWGPARRCWRPSRAADPPRWGGRGGRRGRWASGGSSSPWWWRTTAAKKKSRAGARVCNSPGDFNGKNIKFEMEF